MTIRELRELLSTVENQDAQIAVPTEWKYGVVIATKTPVGIEEPHEGGTVPEGFIALTIE